MANAEQETIRVEIEELERISGKILESLGYSEKECQIVTEILMYAQLRGNTQNLMKFISGAIPTVEKPTDRDHSNEISVVYETALSAQLDGKQKVGMLVLHRAMEMAAQKAKTSGIGMVTTNNTSSTTGAIGYYSRRIAQQGLIGIVMSQSYELVAPFGCKEKIFGTNPLAVGIPLPEGDAISLDMATSSISLFDVFCARDQQQDLPAGRAIDELGNLTICPEQALKGAILPFGGYKGSHLAFVVELLSGALAGGAISDKKDGKNWGNFMLVIDPGMFGDRKGALERFREASDRLKNAEKLPGVTQVYLPGERGDAVERENLDLGSVPVATQYYEKLVEMSQ